MVLDSEVRARPLRARPVQASSPDETIEVDNVGDLDALASGRAGKTGEIDLAAMGVKKLLGSGNIVSGPYRVRVGSFTKRAQAKIEAAGGKIL